jgi:tyrosinase
MISAHAKLIASTYPSDKRSTYVAAAQTLRIPYWDWAVSPSLPSAATATQVTINSPTGSKTIRNPLYSYKFQKYPFTYSGFTGSIASYSQSLRCPSSTSSSASSRFSVCNSNLQRDASYLKNSVVGFLLVCCTTYASINANFSFSVLDIHSIKYLQHNGNCWLRRLQLRVTS